MAHRVNNNNNNTSAPFKFNRNQEEFKRLLKKLTEKKKASR